MRSKAQVFGKKGGFFAVFRAITAQKASFPRLIPPFRATRYDLFPVYLQIFDSSRETEAIGIGINFGSWGWLQGI